MNANPGHDPGDLPRFDRPTAVIVDDEPALARVIALTLKTRGCQAVVASHGLEALDLVTRHRPRLVFIDADLSDIDGVTLVRLVRARRSGTWLVLMGGNEPLLHDADEYLPKPFDIDAIDRIAGRYLEDDAA